MSTYRTERKYMKAKRLLGALLIGASLILGACNGPASSKAASSKPTTSRPTTSIPREPVPAVYYDEMDVVKTGTDVFLSVKGSVEDMEASKLNFAFGLKMYTHIMRIICLFSRYLSARFDVCLCVVKVTNNPHTAKPKGIQLSTAIYFFSLKHLMFWK